MPKRSKRMRTWLTRLLGGLAIVAVAAWAFSAVPVVAWISAAQERIGAMGYWGALLYPLLFAACNIFIIPGGSVVAVGAGLFFGVWLGALQLMAGSVLAAAVAFVISRRFGRRWLEKRFLTRPLWSRLDKAIEHEGWKIVFLSQLHPLFPTSILNYFYGITRIGFWPCLLWVALGQLPGCFVYAYLGTVAHMGVKAARGENELQTLDYALWIGGLLLSIFLFVLLGRLALRLLAEVRAGEDEIASTVLPGSSDNISGA